MKNSLNTLVLLASMNLGLILSSPVQAQQSSPCSNENQAQPSQDDREITNAEYGLRFEIPTNYRAELERSTDSPQLNIFVRNPTDVEYLRCGEENMMRGHGHDVSDVVISVRPLPDNIRTTQDLRQNVLFASGNLDITDFGAMTVGGQDAVVYTEQSSYPMRYRYVKLIHPNGQNLISIYAGDYGEVIDPIDLDVMETIVSSFQIEP